MGDLIIAELCFLIGTVIFLIGMWLKDKSERRKQQKAYEDMFPIKFINTSTFAMMLSNCQTDGQIKHLFKRYGNVEWVLKGKV